MLDGVMYGLLEDRNSQEGHFLKVGDPFQGATIQAIRRDSITLSISGNSRILPVRDDYSMIPLDKTLHPSQQTVHVDSKSDLQLTGTNLLGMRLTSVFDWIGGDDIEKLKDNAFEGRISADELRQRVHGGSDLSSTVTAYFLDLSRYQGETDVEIH